MNDPQSLYANISFDLVKNESKDKILEKQELAFKYFYHLNKSSKIINDAKGMSAFNFTFVNADLREQIEAGITFDFARILVSIIENAYQRIIECFNIETLDEISTRNRTNSLVTALMAVEIANKYTLYSKRFSFKFYEAKGLKSLFNLMNNRKIQQSLVKFKNDSLQTQEFVLTKGIIKAGLSTQLNLARVYHRYLHEWKQCNGPKNLLFYLNYMKSMDTKINTTLIVTYIADDHSIEKSPHVKTILDDLLKLVASCSRKIETKLKLKRKPFEFEGQKEPLDVCYLHFLDIEWNLIHFLDALRNFVVNDENKHAIYFKYEANKYMRSIIYNGNDTEVSAGLEIIWQLSLHKSVAENIKSDHKLYEYICKLSKSSVKSISFNASGILWTLEKYLSNYVYSDDLSKNRHVMICYEKDSIELCKLVKNKLEEANYIVWIHLKDQYEFGLESMSVAIENSLCVLVCFTERFRLNVSCRIQADFAFQLNKPLIPLMMQNNWTPSDEWYVYTC